MSLEWPASPEKTQICYCYKADPVWPVANCFCHDLPWGWFYVCHCILLCGSEWCSMTMVVIHDTVDSIAQPRSKEIPSVDTCSGSNFNMVSIDQAHQVLIAPLSILSSSNQYLSGMPRGPIKDKRVPDLVTAFVYPNSHLVQQNSHWLLWGQ